ncbi:fructose-1,6-bisphosphatase [Enterococcus sp. LJL99]
MVNKMQTNELIAEIINLEAILNLPKGTEHFVSDLHGEFDAFDHILRTGSGSIRTKVQTLFGKELSKARIDELCFLIYYPEDKISLLKQQSDLTDKWWFQTIEQLMKVVRFSSSKYTRSKVRKALPKTYAYILEELIYPYDEQTDKKNYYHQIIRKIIELDEAERFVSDLSYLIRRFVIDHLHVIGDIYDRGPNPDKIMDVLMDYHSVDIQWGNHDIIWLGAVSGSKVCLANVLRICSRYGNLDLLEEVYDIDLTALKEFSLKNYAFNPVFKPKTNPYRTLSEKEVIESTVIQQSMTIIQEKLAGQLIQRRPEFNLSDRLLLDKITDDKITLGQQKISLSNQCFQTIDFTAPYQLTTDEESLIEDLSYQFQQSERLMEHMDFLFEQGSLYLVYNQNLLIHGCIPLTESGEFQAITFDKNVYSGKKLIDFFYESIKRAFQHPELVDDFDTDLYWYLWCGENSSLFGKKAMKTFERYFIEDKTTHKEVKNSYYNMRNDPIICQKILIAFDLLDETSHIINGHTPVKQIKGESPIKAEGKMIVIDGGFSKTYQPITGIGGYTLLYNSFGMQLATHKPFKNKLIAIENNEDILSTKRLVDRQAIRLSVKKTTIGKQLISESNKLSRKLARKSLLP